MNCLLQAESGPCGAVAHTPPYGRRVGAPPSASVGTRRNAPLTPVRRGHPIASQAV